MSEVWMPISKMPGYEVSSEGRVRSMDRLITTSNGQVRRYRGKVISLSSRNQYGHRKAMLHHAGQTTMAYVHVLVAEAFLGPTPPGKIVAHRDGDVDRNIPDNLKHATSQENSDDMIAHGTRLSGEGHPRSKLSLDQVREIRRRRAAKESQYAIAKSLGHPRTTIASVDQGKSWVGVE